MGISLISFFDSFIGFVSKSYAKLELFTEKRKSLLWIISILIFGGIILVLNILTPMIADDFGYLYIFGEKGQVSNLSDLIHSQKNHYVMWGGRSVVHFIAQALLQFPNLVSDILNTSIYLSFMFLIYYHVKGRQKEHSLSLFVLLNLAAWFVLPMFGDTVLWLTGSANYLWGTSIVLLFLLPYRFFDGRKILVSKNIILSCVMFIFGIVAGWTNENTVAGMLVIIVLLFLYYRAQEWSIPLHLILGLIGGIVGYIIMIVAPGNFVRATDAPSTTLFLIAYRIFNYTQYLFLHYGVLIILYGVLLTLFRKGDRSTSPIHLSLIYIVGALAAIYVMVLSPQFPARAWFGIVSFLLIALGSILYRLNYKELSYRQMRSTIILVGCIAFSFSLFNATKDIIRVYEIDKEREIIAQKAREAGEEVCYFTRFQSYTPYVHSEDESTHNLLSYYYGILVEYK